MQFRNLAAGATLGMLATLASVSFAANEKKDVAAIEAAVAGSWRPADAKDRDADRHPAASLEFWGLKPGMKILEVQPGGGWWTAILAPYARANKGEFYATGADLADPEALMSKMDRLLAHHRPLRLGLGLPEITAEDLTRDLLAIAP